jgi:hypothetical protein
MSPPGDAAMSRPAAPRIAAPLAALALALFAAPAARAQDFDDADEDEAPQAQGRNPRAFVYTIENFDQWVFGNGRNEAGFRRAADAQLAMKVDQIDLACGLDDAQKARLRLAGRGDLERILDAYAEKKTVFLATKGDQNRVQEVFQAIQPLQATIQAGLFGEGSLFAKSVPRALKPSQAERFEAIDRERRAYQYRAKVEMAVHLLDNFVGMTADQRRRAITAIVEETRPPRRFGRQDYQVVMFLASKMPEAKLRPIFDDAQWRKVRGQMDGVQGLETFFRANGLLPDEGGKR